MKVSDIKEKDASFLRAIVEQNGSATSSEIREWTENEVSVTTLNSDDVSYRRRKFNGESSSWTDELIEIISQGTNENGGNLPNIVKIKEERLSEIEEVVDEYYGDEVELERFDSVEEGFNQLLSEIQRIEDSVEEGSNTEGRLDDVESEIESIKSNQRKLKESIEELHENQKKLNRRLKDETKVIEQ